MMRITSILFLVLLCLKSFGQESGYYHEEFRAIDDIFLSIADTSSYNYSLWPLFSVEELIDDMNDSLLRESLNYFLPPYKFEPFDIIGALKSTNGDSLLIKELYENYETFRDSINGLPDPRTLMIFSSDSLYQFNSSDINWMKSIQSFFKYKHLDSVRYDTLRTRYFSFNKLNNKGRYSFSNLPYPDQTTRFETKEIKELYSISFSRVLFNDDYTKGALFYTIFRDPLSANRTLVLIKKKRGKWTIHKRISIWIS